ncbi:amidase domain-containing protein [Peptostreptococcus sp. D1]|uniref:amidase domain-containing protein n=1 Tax=Peptostreptococcus sp. D1 TaxID=72304 RepID=UPI000B862D35|nr:amidase domain-containing protein [Peptostreptococcus sp. D1]
MCTGIYSIDLNRSGKRMLYHANIGKDNLNLTDDINSKLNQIIRNSSANSNIYVARNKMNDMLYGEDATNIRKSFISFVRDNDLSEQEAKNFLDYIYEIGDYFEPNSYDIKIAFNEYVMNRFLNENFVDGIETFDEAKMKYIIQHYDELKQQYYYLEEEEYVDLLYSLMTRLNDFSNNVNSELISDISSKSEYFKKYNVDLISTRALPSYNAKGAVEYAKANLKRTAPGYYNFHQDGGDCANFISQCLYEGGGMEMREVNGDKYNNSNWYYYGNGNSFPYKYSATWAQASNFKHHWGARAGISVHDVPKDTSRIYFRTEYGTPISIIRKNTGQARHTIIVGGKRGTNDYWYYDHSGGNFDNSLLKRVRGEKIVQETLTF